MRLLDGAAAPITVATAAKLVGQHAAHLDITLDDAAAILAAEHN